MSTCVGAETIVTTNENIEEAGLTWSSVVLKERCTLTLHIYGKPTKASV